MRQSTEHGGNPVIKLCAFGEPSLFAADGARMDGVARGPKPLALLSDSA